MLDKELLIFPILSLLALGTVLASIALPIFAGGDIEGTFAAITSDPEYFENPIFYVAGFAVYFALYFIMIFFNAALIACVKIRFAGGDPTVMDGLRASVANLPKIFFWALFTATIGFILNQLGNKSSGIMKFVIGLVGAGWSIASFFAIPIIVSEKVGPITAVKRSVAIIRKTWGEALIAEVGLSALFGIFGFAIVLLMFASVIVFEISVVLGAALIFILVSALILLILVLTTLSTILKAALYVYAIDGKIPDQFDDDMITGAFPVEQASKQTTQ